MTKGRIISALIIISALAIAGGVYQFYFAAKLEAYQKDKELKELLEAKALEIETDFEGTEPDIMLNAWKSALVPWNNGRNRRAVYFNFGDWSQHEKFPKTGGMIKYWYDEEQKKMMTALFEKVREKRVMYFPPDIRSTLHIPHINQWQGRNVSEEVAHAELARFSFGLSACELLLDNNVKAVRNVWLWKPRIATEYSGLVNIQSVGYDTVFTLNDLVAFFEKLRAEDRYFNIDALRLTYNTPANTREPMIDAQFILTQAEFINVDPTQTLTGGDDEYGSGYGGTYGGYGPVGPAEKPPFWDPAWRWFKRYILVTS